MNTKIAPSSLKNKVRKLKKRPIALVAIGLSMVSYCTYSILQNNITYESLNIAFTSNKEVEYGTEKFDPKKLIAEISEGALTNYTKAVDTSKVGTQKLTFEVKKDNVIKKFSVLLKIKDTNVPVIELKEKEVNIYAGDAYDLNSNIQSVSDVVDGAIPYSENDVSDSSYYTINYSEFDYNKVGDYTIYIKAYDANGNISEDSFLVHVKEKPAPRIVAALAPQQVTYSNAPSTVDTSSVLAAARSLLGTRYVSGGGSPETGFDCSGFTSYIFGVTGVSISRSSAGQLSNGVAVSEDNLQPGDLIIWANDGSNTAAHSSVYAGGNTIIHATSNKGVQQTNLDNWKSWGQHIIGIRRV